MNITIFGCELTGLVLAGCLAKEGNNVALVATEDVDKRSGGASLTHAEPILTFLLSSQVIEQKLVYMTDWHQAIEHADIFFICINSWMPEMAEKIIVEIGKNAAQSVIVVNQTTFSVGKAKEFEKILEKNFRERNVNLKADVLAMPEFISRGTAVNDFMNPDRIVLGGEDTQAIATITQLLAPFYKQQNKLKIMSSSAAEYTKYALNAILATRISLINELANNAEKFGIDFAEVREGIGSDSRIGFNYIDPGCGFGGPSFASDMDSLIKAFEEKGADSRLLKAAIDENEIQKELLFRKAWRYFNNDIATKRFAVWGLSFKAKTETVENAPSLVLVEALISQGASVAVFDPQANDSFMQHFKYADSVIVSNDKYEILEQVDGLFVLTDWDEFTSPDFNKMTSLMKNKIIFDGRNIYEPAEMAKENFVYFGTGRGKAI